MARESLHLDVMRPARTFRGSEEHGKQLLAMWLAFFVIAGTTYHVPPVLLPALMKEFGTDQYGISWLPAVFQLLKGIFTVPGGYALDKFGCTACIRFGTLVVLVASICYPLAPNLVLLGAVHGIYGFAYDLSGLAAFIVLCTSWFMENRAFGIGILVTAFSMAGVCFPPVIAWVAAIWGWRYASGLCPMAIALVACPLTLCILKDGPFLPSSHRPEEDCTGPRNEPPLSFYLKSSIVWHLTFLSFYQLYTIIALINTLVLYLKTDGGMPLQTSSFYASTVFQASIVGKLCVGAALDTRWQASVGLGSCVLLLLGTLLPLDFASFGCKLTTNHSQLFLFAVVYGLGFGCSFTVLTSKPAKLFGKMRGFGKLQGFLMFFQVLGGFSGTLLTGKLRKVTGNYLSSFYVFIAMAFMSCVHYLALELRLARRGQVRPSTAEIA